MPYYNDDGTEINPNLIPTPGLCLICAKKDNPHEEIMCTMNRMDQAGEKEFICYAYEAIGKA